MTQRSVIRSQSKLAVQAHALGSGVPAISAVLGAMAAVNILVHCPASGVIRFRGVCCFCLRKDDALVSHCVPGLGVGEREDDEECWGDGTFHVRRLLWAGE
ncbi:hypothetical protein [Desulfosporosinus sp. SB140]|uniref:hypothetical protein n=1 Tax=Desulfosporosinus paludis TaxID=3115649 RepID=UPI003890CA21